MVSKPFGFLIVDKPSGITSHDCVNVIRKIYSTKRVGHGGTLDPGVTGVLPIAVGNATRLFKFLNNEKAYEAKIQLGVQTSTDDLFGEIVSQNDWPILNKTDLENLLKDFCGEILQRPPMISSIKINGERAYKKARSGKTFELPPRVVRIFNLNLLKWDKHKGLISIYIECSSGTYIRSLARDIGIKLNCGGTLHSLRRTKALGFKIEDSIKLPKYSNDISNAPVLVNPLKGLIHLTKYKIKKINELEKWRKGQSLNIESKELIKPNTLNLKVETKDIIIIFDDDIIEGIGLLVENNIIKPKIVFNAKG